jgi:hypothetical protein
MKRIALTVLFLALIAVEIYLCSAFLPAAWQIAMARGLSHISQETFDYSVVTHPALDYEFEDVLRKNVGLRVALYTVIVLLLVGNTLVIAKVWRYLRLKPRQGERGATRT